MNGVARGRQVVEFPGTDPRGEQCRALCRAASLARYDGWNDDYDRQFDAYSVWFAIEEEGAILACCRLVHRWYERDGRRGAQMNRLPCELHLLHGRLPFRSPSIEARFHPRGTTRTIRALEISGVAWREHDMRGLFEVIDHMSDALAGRQHGPCFSVVDRDNADLLRLHFSVLLSRPVPGVYRAPGFCHRGTRVPVTYQIVAVNPEDHDARMRHVRARLAAITGSGP